MYTVYSNDILILVTTNLRAFKLETFPNITRRRLWQTLWHTSAAKLQRNFERTSAKLQPNFGETSAKLETFPNITGRRLWQTSRHTSAAKREHFVFVSPISPRRKLPPVQGPLFMEDPPPNI
jgi:hypothetical protein